MKNINGFTLIEVVVTIIIVAILSVIGTTVYRKHLDNSKYSEGLRLIQSIKEQEDLALTFSSSDTAKNPFILTGGNVITTTFTFDRNAQNLGNFYIYPHHYKYFRSFEIRLPMSDEKIEYDVIGHGYVVEAYYPAKNNYMLKLKLVGSAEGAYTIVKQRRN